MKKFFRLVFSLLMIAFIVLSPSFIKDGIDKSVYTLRKEEKDSKYTGMLELWHIVSFKTPERSGTSLLSTRAGVFEKQNTYVYIDLYAMTAEEAKEKLNAGERPDIISFPLGFIAEEELGDLEKTHKLMPAYSDLCTNAYPYMADSYRLFCNSSVLTEKQLPFSSEITENEFYRVTNGNSIAGTKNSDHLPSCALAFPDFAEEDMSFITEEETTIKKEIIFREGSELFFQSEAAFYVAPLSETKNILADKTAGNFGLQAYRISHYTDLVQMIGYFPQEDEKKNAICRQFCESMLSEAVQKAVLSCNMMPVIRQKREESTALSEREEEAVLIGTSGIIPQNDLLHFERENLKQLSISACKNDADKQKLYELLIKEKAK